MINRVFAHILNTLIQLWIASVVTMILLTIIL